ncbi:hypothetical protein ADT30_10290 [Xylella fastidiosa]|nr:hypothetical protein ADT30_10290 [Xylella fastidiosa]
MCAVEQKVLLLKYNRVLHCTALHCTALHCTALLLRISSGIFCISHLAFAAAVSVNGVAAWSEIGIALCRSFGFL